MKDEYIEIPREAYAEYGLTAIPKRALKTMSLGDALREARSRANLAISEASAQSGVATGAISTIERGKTRQPGLDTLMALAETYGVDPLELIEAAGYKIKQPLPEFKPYLRQKYRNMPKDAKAELDQAFERITAKYGITHQAGPVNDEDEGGDPEPQVTQPGGDSSV